MDTARDVNFSHPSPQRNNPLWHKQGGGVGRPGLGAKSTGGGLQRVTDRSQLSPQAPAEGPGPGHSCMAKDLKPTPELPPGRAMHSNAGEKSDRVGPGPAGTELGFAEPRWKDSEEFNLLPSSPSQGLGHQSPRPAPSPGQGHPRCSQLALWGMTPRVSTVATSRPTAQTILTVHKYPGTWKCPPEQWAVRCAVAAGARLLGGRLLWTGCCSEQAHQGQG